MSNYLNTFDILNLYYLMYTLEKVTMHRNQLNILNGSFSESRIVSIKKDVAFIEVVSGHQDETSSVIYTDKYSILQSYLKSFDMGCDIPKPYKKSIKIMKLKPSVKT